MTIPNADRRTALMVAATSALTNETDNTWHCGVYYFRPDDVQTLIDCGFLECVEPGGGAWPSIWRASDAGMNRLRELRTGEQP